MVESFSVSSRTGIWVGVVTISASLVATYLTAAMVWGLGILAIGAVAVTWIYLRTDSLRRRLK